MKGVNNAHDGYASYFLAFPDMRAFAGFWVGWSVNSKKKQCSNKLEENNQTNLQRLKFTSNANVLVARLQMAKNVKRFSFWEETLFTFQVSEKRRNFREFEEKKIELYACKLHADRQKTL